MSNDLIVVGAGLAGLACARAARARGLAVTVLEKSRDVGGRCATRRFDGQPVDFGLAFLHGRDPGFLAALDAVPDDALRGWPRRVRGTGRPCQPEAFTSGEPRVAFTSGVKAFSRHLATGLDVRCGVRVTRLEPLAGGIALHTEAGERSEAPRIALALPAEQALALVEPLGPADGGARTAAALLGMLGTLPCLALVAIYPPGVYEPEWEMWYPEDSPVLQLLAHDSSKRPAGARRALVLQAHPHWSHAQLETPVDAWSRALLDEAGRLAGAWAAAPALVHPHRWRFARADRGAELAQPLVVALAGGGTLALAGEMFAPGGGAGAAFASGTALGARLATEAR